YPCSAGAGLCLKHREARCSCSVGGCAMERAKLHYPRVISDSWIRKFIRTRIHVRVVSKEHSSTRERFIRLFEVTESGCCEAVRNIDIPVTSAERRQKWASQIREAVDQLHGVGVIWGDGKGSNVIVDEKDNAWLIDFGGGFTEGWVDKELA